MSRLAVLGSIALITAVPAGAGVVYEIETINYGDSQKKAETVQASVEGRNLKMGIASAGGGKPGEMIFRGERREMVAVDHDRKSYFVIDEKTMESLASQMNQAMAEMEKAMAGMPEAQRAQVEAMMKGRMPQQAAPRPEVEVRKTGERAEHGGYSCVMHDVLQDGHKIRQMCVTSWSNLEGSEEVVEVFEEMAEFFREMLDAMPRMGGANAPGGGLEDNFFEHMKELDGFPVYTLEFDDDGSLESESTLRSAKRQSIDPDAFEPPSGYKRQDMFGSR